MLRKDSKCFCGMDLHSNNTVIAVLDETGKKIFNGKFHNKMAAILKALHPFKDRAPQKNLWVKFGHGKPPRV